MLSNAVYSGGGPHHDDNVTFGESYYDPKIVKATKKQQTIETREYLYYGSPVYEQEVVNGLENSVDALYIPKRARKPLELHEYQKNAVRGLKGVANSLLSFVGDKLGKKPITLPEVIIPVGFTNALRSDKLSQQTGKLNPILTLNPGHYEQMPQIAKFTVSNKGLEISCFQMSVSNITIIKSGKVKRGQIGQDRKASDRPRVLTFNDGNVLVEVGDTILFTNQASGQTIGLNMVPSETPDCIYTHKGRWLPSVDSYKLQVTNKRPANFNPYVS
ncbi:MAG: hypothetical protein WCJ19_01420 [bacterium]